MTGSGGPQERGSSHCDRSRITVWDVSRVKLEVPGENMRRFKISKVGKGNKRIGSTTIDEVSTMEVQRINY